KISPILRTAADMSGGFIASCRNPIRASYVKQHAALGGISRALKLGAAIIAAEPKGGAAVIDAICKETDGSIIGTGKVLENNLQYTNEAFDIGTILVKCGKNVLTLHVMNEHMAVTTANGDRIACYPDI